MLTVMPKAQEVFYLTHKGRQDRNIHEPILRSGDHKAAESISRELLRQRGWSPERIEAFFTPPSASE
jgi:hypothetical protein